MAAKMGVPDKLSFVVPQGEAVLVVHTTLSMIVLGSSKWPMPFPPLLPPFPSLLFFLDGLAARECKHLGFSITVGFC